MRHLPTYDAVAERSASEMYGFLATHAREAVEAKHEFAWQRDQALRAAVDAALHAAAKRGKATEQAKPPWLQGLVVRDLRSAAASYWSGEAFVRARLLERLGAIELEHDDNYVLAMVSGFGERKPDKLRADPELVESTLWRLFEVEGGGEVSLANVDRFGGDEWRTTFVELSADGTLDRARVLRECLRTLARDFAAYRAQWFSATFLAFEPSLDELESLQPELRRLLAASVPATVGFALKQLLPLQKAERLEVEETLAALPPATLVKAKGTALDALRLARVHVRTSAGAAADVARTALGHPHADVQRVAVALLEAAGAADGLAEAADELAPSVRVELGLASDATAGDETPVAQRLMPAPEPVTTDDLAERTAALLEDASDVAGLEAVLAALVEPGSERALAPLRKRALAVVARGPRTDMRDSWLPGQVARLVLDLLGQPAEPARGLLAAQRFVVRRLGELREHPGPLLATPDLPGGWVSPDALVRRLEGRHAPRHHDLVAALLRLHPDGREHAARGAAVLPPAVRFALGGQPTERREGPEAWWVAARRSRAPYAADELPQVAGEPVRTEAVDNGKPFHYWTIRFTIVSPGHVAAGSGGGLDDQPTELKGQLSAYSALADWVPTLAAIWPHDAEHALALTCNGVLDAWDWELNHDVPRVLDALAQSPGRLGGLAALTLAAGLSATHRHHRLHAVDAFVDLVPTGRLESTAVAGALAKYAPAWQAGRWAESLASVAHAPGGAAAVVSLLTALLPQLPSDQRGLNKLLDVLRDQTIHLSTPVADPKLVDWLGRLRGSSAAARTAQRLLDEQ